MANKVLKKKMDAVAVSVVGEGTKLMKSIKFHTRIIKFSNTKLRRSRIYYVILEV